MRNTDVSSVKELEEHRPSRRETIDGANSRAEANACDDASHLKSLVEFEDEGV